jgi:hypothetical protein
MTIFERSSDAQFFAEVVQTDLRRLDIGRPTSQVVYRPQVARPAGVDWAAGNTSCTQVDQRGAPG